jgi:hypothetical protein
MMPVVKPMIAARISKDDSKMVANSKAVIEGSNYDATVG